MTGHLRDGKKRWMKQGFIMMSVILYGAAEREIDRIVKGMMAEEKRKNIFKRNIL